MAPNKLESTLFLVNNKIKFSGCTRNNPPVTMDYFPPAGNGEGYTGLEMLLLTLSGCSATAVTVMLRKMNKTVSDLQVNATGIRQETAPFAFSSITLNFILTSPDSEIEDLEKAIHLAETSVCPVWAMLRGNVEIIVKPEVKIRDKD